MEIALLIACGVMLVSIAVLANTVRRSDTVAQKQIDEHMDQLRGGICTTPTCVVTSAAVIESMDMNVKPCDDFYLYACGNWKKKHHIPSGQSKWGNFQKLTSNNELILKNTLGYCRGPYGVGMGLRGPEMNITMSGALLKTKNYYKSCMDEHGDIESLDSSPLLEFSEKIGTWNLLDKNWNVSNWEFMPTLEKLHSYGYYVFFAIWVSEDQLDTTTNVIQIDQGVMALSRERYINETVEDNKILSAYVKLMVDLAQMLNPDLETDATTRAAEDVVHFENKIAKVDWPRYLNTSLMLVGEQVSRDLPIVIHAEEYLGEISDLVELTMRTDRGKRTINNFFHWMYVRTMATFLSSKFREVRKKFIKVLTGQVGDDERWRYCTSDTTSQLGFALGAMYINDTFKSGSKEKAEDMIRRVKSAFVEDLKSVSWIDDTTKRRAVEKADMIRDKIGYPSFILDPIKLDKYYEDMNISSRHFFRNNIISQHVDILRNYRELGMTPNQNVWHMVPSEVNAYYTPTKNEIVFPAGILQAPFYAQQRPKSLNYGGMGVVMGHELTHAFDDLGRKFDKKGNMKQWWTNASIYEFNYRSQCFIKQYSDFKVYGKPVNGMQTLGENIADNGGLKSSFKAYREWVEEFGQEQRIAGLEHLSHEQLFFIAFAQVWCSRTTKQASVLQIETDPHAPPNWRVIGTMRNSLDFRRTFGCSRGDGMFKKDICEVW